jgi:hypothetical protein
MSGQVAGCPGSNPSVRNSTGSALRPGRSEDPLRIRSRRYHRWSLRHDSRKANRGGVMRNRDREAEERLESGRDLGFRSG